MTQRALTSKPFWAYEIITTVLLSLNVVLWIGRSPLAILLIVLTFAITNSIAWIVCKDRIGIRCFLSWLFGGAAYILDIALIDIFRMSTHESYPLIMGSVLLAPLFAAISGVICLSIWIVTANNSGCDTVLHQRYWCWDMYRSRIILVVCSYRTDCHFIRLVVSKAAAFCPQYRNSMGISVYRQVYMVPELETENEPC